VSTATYVDLCCPTCGREAWECEVTTIVTGVPLHIDDFGRHTLSIHEGQVVDYEVSTLRCEDGHDWKYPER
jgi:hypothetical protein